MHRVVSSSCFVRAALASLLVLSAAITAGCKSKPTTTEASPVATSVLSGKKGTELRPLAAANAKMQLDLPESSAVELVLPLGITHAAPILVILGEAQSELTSRCDDWHGMSAKRTFTLCLSALEGDFISGGRTEASAVALRQALREIRKRFQEYVKPSSVVLVGRGNEADVVVQLVRQSPSVFSRVALIDSGFAKWSAVDSAMFAKVEGFRAWLACRSKGCVADASRVTATLRALGVPTRLTLPPAEAVGENVEVAKGSAATRGIAKDRAFVGRDEPHLLAEDRDAIAWLLAEAAK